MLTFRGESWSKVTAIVYTGGISHPAGLESDCFEWSGCPHILIDLYDLSAQILSRVGTPCGGMCAPFFLLPFFFFGAKFDQMTLAPETEEIVAAGGVVFERTDNHVRVVLIHRPKYQDWSLPKGKAEPGESITQTALREVREETGLVCRIVQELEQVRYSYRTGKDNLRPKTVHYFLMKPVGGRLEAPGQEADAARWFDADEAIRLLTYEHDRELLQKALRLE